MDIVLGVSMAPTTVRMVLVEGENADGVTVEEDNFEVVAADGAATSGAPEQVIAAILGTREGAAEGGYRLMSTGVTWTEPTEVAALRDALAFREMRSVMLVSPLLAAAALTQTVGDAMDYAYTALLFVEPESATLAVVETTDGSIVDLHRQRVHCARRSAEAVTELAAMVAGLDGLESRPDGVFVVGCGVDIVPIKPQLDATVSIPVSAPEEPDMALARGAALASANAPLFASSTAALAYAQDPGTGEVNPNALAPAYLDVSANARLGDSALAYSALADEEVDEGLRANRPFLLASSGVAAAVLIGIVALAISLVADVGPTVGQQTSPPRKRRPHEAGAGAAERARTCGGRAGVIRAASSTAAIGRTASTAAADDHGADSGGAPVAAAGCDPGPGLSGADSASTGLRAASRSRPGATAGRAASAAAGRTPATPGGRAAARSSGAAVAADGDVPASAVCHDPDSDQPAAAPRRQGRSSRRLNAGGAQLRVAQVARYAHTGWYRCELPGGRNGRQRSVRIRSRRLRSSVSRCERGTARGIRGGQPVFHHAR